MNDYSTTTSVDPATAGALGAAAGERHGAGFARHDVVEEALPPFGVLGQDAQAALLYDRDVGDGVTGAHQLGTRR